MIINDRISQLAAAALESTKSTPSHRVRNPEPKTPSADCTERAKPRPTLVSSAPPLSKIEFNTRLLSLSMRDGRSNRRRSHQKPPLLLAVSGFVACLCAVFATSTTGMAQINAELPELIGRSIPSDPPEAFWPADSESNHLSAVSISKN